MDAISGLGGDFAMTVASLAATGSGDAAGVAVLKKGLDTQQSLAEALLQVLPPPPSINKGSSFDAYA